MITYSKPPFMSILRPWHPLNQLRLLWWLAVDRVRFDAYRLQVGEEAIRSAVAWLVGFLICVPSLIVVLGISLGLASTTDRGYESNLLWIGLLVIVWLLNGVIGKIRRKWVRDLLFVVSAITASTIVRIAAQDVGSAPALGMGMYYVSLAIEFSLIESANVDLYERDSFGYAIFMGTFRFGDGIGIRSAVVSIALVIILIPLAIIQNRSQERGQPSLASWFVLLMLFFAYVVLAWVYLLGGWHGF
jgi:hypothetical protein